MSEKPSKNEDEYFALREAEILKARKKAAEQASLDSERRSHNMRCPKCGGHLKTEEYHEIQVDRCPDCLGIWFDAGEAESLLREEGGGVGGIFKTLIRGIQPVGKKPKPA